MIDTWKVDHPFIREIVVTPTQREARVTTCNECEHLSGIYICKQCGCVMPLKTWLKTSECPRRKW